MRLLLRHLHSIWKHFHREGNCLWRLVSFLLSGKHHRLNRFQFISWCLDTSKCSSGARSSHQSMEKWRWWRVWRYFRSTLQWVQHSFSRFHLGAHKLQSNIAGFGGDPVSLLLLIKSLFNGICRKNSSSSASQQALPTCSLWAHCHRRRPWWIRLYQSLAPDQILIPTLMYNSLAKALRKVLFVVLLMWVSKHFSKEILTRRSGCMFEISIYSCS